MSICIEKWGFYEGCFKGTKEGNPFLEVELTTVFKHENKSVEVNGFYDGDGIYKVRFMPDILGKWTFTTKSNIESLSGIGGDFECVEPKSVNHGTVRVKNQYHFEYADGTHYYPFGTTCYAWIHQSIELQEKTLETLRESAFNKIRMCVFPKYYDYNHNEPELYPYESSVENGFDFTKFNAKFFRHLEKRILGLQELGIECDLILFHPYDKWGFSQMSAENDDRYLKYIVSRLSAFRNIWWSMANEYDLLSGKFDFHKMGTSKKNDDWERLAYILQKNDPYEHLKSIHNFLEFYDYKKPWITHCSIQRIDRYKTSENTDEWRTTYGKPVVIDECAYEGNINYDWGNITGQEMTRRFWEGVVRGGYVGHGETYVHPQNILWWSHGGELHGTSPARIAFLRKILEDAPGEINRLTANPDMPYWDVTVGSVEEEYFLFYFGFNQPAFRNFKMGEGKKYKVDIIDTWNMTITELSEIYSGEFCIDMPGTQYIAIRMIRVN